MTACLVWRGRRVPQARSTSTDDDDEARIGALLSAVTTNYR